MSPHVYALPLVRTESGLWTCRLCQRRWRWVLDLRDAFIQHGGWVPA